MKLILEIREQANETPMVGDSASAVAFTPPVSEDYWSHRVRLSDTQAVIGFPKYSTVGIGFAVEEDSWNTNLPYSCPTDQILKHIIDNKGDEEIDDADVREAILMIQLAVIDERTEARRPAFSSAAQLMRTGVTTVPYEVFDQLLTDQESAMREHAMLRAEVDHLRAAAKGVDSVPREEPSPFDPTAPQVGVPADEAYRDHNGRIWVAHGGGAAGTRRLYLAGWERGIEAAVDDMEHLRAVADPTFPGLSPIPDGSRGFVSLLLRLGVPTKDSRVLAVDGKYEMRNGADVPIRSLVDEAAPHVSDVVARIVGLWRVDDDIYAVGVAGPELAEDLNLSRLILGADLDADIVEGGPQGDPPLLTISSGRVLGAMVRRPEDFAWATS